MVFVCNPRKNTHCKKTGCYEKNEYPCFATLNPECADAVIIPLDEECKCHSCKYGAYFNSTQGWQCGKFSKEMCAERNGYEPIHVKEDQT